MTTSITEENETKADDSIDWDGFMSEDETEFVAAVEPEEIPEYVRIKVPSKDNFMTISVIYNGREEEHMERPDIPLRWLTDENDEPYKFDNKEDARLFLALNVDPSFIRPTDRPQSIKAYAIKK